MARDDDKKKKRRKTLDELTGRSQMRPVGRNRLALVREEQEKRKKKNKKRGRPMPPGFGPASMQTGPQSMPGFVGRGRRA